MIRLRTIIHHRLFAWIVVIGTLITTVSMIGNLWQVTHRPDNTSQQAAEVDELQNQIDELKKDIQDQNSAENQERVIRDQLNMQKEGEVIIQLPPLPSPTPFSLPSPTPTPPVIQQWWTILFDKPTR